MGIFLLKVMVCLWMRFTHPQTITLFVKEMRKIALIDHKHLSALLGKFISLIRSIKHIGLFNKKQVHSKQVHTSKK